MTERETIIIDSRADNVPLAERMRRGDLQWEGIKEMAGWKRLTQRQRAMIRASRMVQKQSDQSMREERGSHWSNSVVRQWFCHYSVRSLEREEIMPFREYLRLMGGAKTGDFWGDYFEHIEWLDDPNELLTILDEAFPQVIHIGRKVYPEEKRRGSGRIMQDEMEAVQMKHSCVALGRSEEGDVMVWEKIAERYPFNFTVLQDVLDRYPQCDRFALRPLERRTVLGVSEI